MTFLYRGIVAGLGFACCVFSATAQDRPVTNDIPQTFTVPKRDVVEAPKVEFDYVKRVEMVPMRDGVKLYTVIVIPKGAVHAPIMLTRTPYNAAARAAAARKTAGGRFRC